MKIIISADGRKLCASTGGQPLTSGSVGIEAAFVLSADYDGLAVTAVFRAGDVSVDVLLTGPRCIVPWEVLETSGHVLIVGVVGKNGSGEIVIPTIWGRVGMVECGTVAEGIDPQDPTPDIAAQLLQIAQETVERAETAETAATEAAGAAGESATAAGEAKNDAETAAQDAETAAQDAEAARQAIEDLSVEAHEAPDGPSVEKTVDPETGAVTLDFGIPPAPEVPVQSVNGKTGAVQLTLDDIPDGTEYARTTPAQVQQIGDNADGIDAIEGKIPAEASETNQLADKAFVSGALAPYRTASDQDVIDDAQNDRLDDLEQATTAATVGPAPIVTFDASAADMPLKQVVVDIEPVQAGSGDPSPDNVRPISGWTGCNVARAGMNIWNEEWERGAYNQTTGAKQFSDNAIRSKDYISVCPNTTYFACSPAAMRIFTYDASQSFLGTFTNQNDTFTTGANVHYITFNLGGVKTYENNISFNYPSTDHDYHAYVGRVYPIAFPSEAGTVYGGTLTTNSDGSGELAVEKASVDMSTLSWSFVSAQNFFVVTPLNIQQPVSSYDEIISSCYKSFAGKTDSEMATAETGIYVSSNGKLKLKDTRYSSVSELKTGVSGQTLVYPIDIPDKISLTGIPEITILLGTNNIWADCGDISVTYGAYLETLKASLDRTNVELDTLRACIAPIEDGATASQVYSQGAYFFRNGQFCTALTAISVGAAFTLGTNYQATTVAAALIALQS